MPRYIDADKFISWLDVGHLRSPSEICLSELNVLKMIDLQPTADVAEVKHGEWKPDYETFVDDFGIESEPIITGWICSLCAANEPCKSHYCPNCGAKMDGETE